MCHFVCSAAGGQGVITPDDVVQAVMFCFRLSKNAVPQEVRAGDSLLLEQDWVRPEGCCASLGWLVRLHGACCARNTKWRAPQSAGEAVLPQGLRCLLACLPACRRLC
jgi:hypothetical protein